MVKSIAFGFISGVSTTLGLLPHIFALFFLLTRDNSSSFLAYIIIFTVGARLLGEWLFLNFSKSRMDSENELKNWRATFDWALFSYPNIIISLAMILMDLTLDINLINFALKTPLPTVWVFLALLSCQALASPIQGFLSDIFSRKKSIIFAAAMGTLAMVLANDVIFSLKNPELSTTNLLHFVGLSSFRPSVQMLIILCGKGLLANLSVVGRASIAEIIQVETIRKFSKL